MNTKYLELKNIFDLNKWQTMQDSISSVTNLAIITIDYKGNPVTKHSNVRPFCHKMRSDPELRKLCEKCDARGGLEAVRGNSPYIYLCHWGIVDIAIPITIEDKYVGAIMAGEVKMADDEDSALEHMLTIQTNQGKFAMIKDNTTKLFHQIPKMPYSKMKESVQMLYNLCNYIVQEAMEKNYLIEMLGKEETNGTSNYDTVNESCFNQWEESAQVLQFKPPFNNDSVLQPAFNYLEKHINEKVTQQQMAKLCHLSTSYFSRLFTKETGMNFTAFVSLKKLEMAKSLLNQTNLTIAEISEQLGFNEPSYFTKIFKKHENLTPKEYRKIFPRR
ncbi:PocR ligand-binding domain-containing protein [Bacillus kwashiorkori]|uniref:PocR ligand-binding domain-containing protein n=1 Tax=Bacillus kwashiorkori TaxID=1522318 RepID=UPI0007866438|nr:PocR ligand-binding domain-containing protein [Bacillus kwashiorkori]